MTRVRGLLVVFGLVAIALAWQISGHFRPWTSFQQQWVAAFGAAAIVLAAVLRHSRTAWPWPAVSMAALAVVPLLQGLLGQVVYLSDWLLAVLYLATFALCIVAAHHHAVDEPDRWPDNLMWAVLAGSAIAAALALMQWLRVDFPYVSVEPLTRSARVYANLAQPNHLATLQCLGIAATLYFFERRALTVLTTVLLIGVVTWALVMTQSRVGWVFGFVIAAAWWPSRHSLRLRGDAVAAGLLLYIGATLIWPQLNEALLLAEPSAGLAERVSAGTRPANWLALIEASLRKPWFGWGWTQVSPAQLAIGFERRITDEVIQNAHNVMLDLVIWMGWPAALIVTLLALRWLWRQVQYCRDARHWAVLLAIAAIGIHALTEYPLDYTYFLFPLGLLIGTAHRMGPPARAWSSGRGPVIAAWTACMGMLFWIAAEYLQVEDAARNLRLSMTGVGVDKVPHVPAPDVILLDAPREFHRFWITPAAHGMSAERLDWMRQVAHRNHHPPVLLRYALAAGLNGRPEEAAQMLQAICNINAEIRCREARESWQMAIGKWPELASIKPP